MAIATIDDNFEGSHEHASEDVDDRTPSLGKSTLNPRLKPGKIGEGKPNPLSKLQRKRVLYVTVLVFALALISCLFCHLTARRNNYDSP